MLEENYRILHVVLHLGAFRVERSAVPVDGAVGDYSLETIFGHSFSALGNVAKI
jgi:hypothetical protein